MFHIRNKRKQSVDKTNSVAASATGTPSPSMRSERRYSLRRVPSQLSSMLKSIDLYHHGNNSNNGSDSHLPQADNTNGRTSRRQSMTKATVAKISSSTEQRFNKLLRHTRRGSHQQQQQEQPSSHLPLPRVKDPFFNPKRASWSPFGNERWSSLVQVKENTAATDTTAIPSTPRLPPLEDQSSFLLDIPSSSVSVTNSTESTNSNSNIRKRRNSSAIRHHDTSGDSCAACLASSNRRKQTCHSSEKITDNTNKIMDDNHPANDLGQQQNDDTMAEKQQQPLVQEVVVPTTTPLSPQPLRKETTPLPMPITTQHASESMNAQEAESSHSDEKRVVDIHNGSAPVATSVTILQAVSGNDNHAAAILVSPCVKQESSCSSFSDCQLAQNIVNCIQRVDQVESTQTLQGPLASLVRSCLSNNHAQNDHKQKVQACQSLLKQIDSSGSQHVSQVTFSSHWSLLYPTLWLGGTMTAGSIVSEHAKTGHIVIAGTCIANDPFQLPKEYHDTLTSPLLHYVLFISHKERTTKFAKCSSDKWIPDHDAQQCQVTRCHTPFTLFQRRHHCRSCGHVVCSKHSANKSLLFDHQNKSEWCRVCDECFYRF
ncbi:FYVE-domain-containing protein, partial [Lichtheimia hyalospora FSU 10163]